MKYLLVIGTTGKQNNKPTLRDINIAIDSLDANNSNPFIILEPSEAIENTNYIQVLYYSKVNNDTNHYLIEIQIMKKTDLSSTNIVRSIRLKLKIF